MSADHLAEQLHPDVALPTGGGALVGRAWLPEEGPSVVSVREGTVFDLTPVAPTMTDLINSPEPRALADADAPAIGDVGEILANSSYRNRHHDQPWLLAPVDLQPIKASGVTFAVSLLERVIEEQADGDKSRADHIREEVQSIIGEDLSRLVPGSEEALELKTRLIESGAWSQYLEVGIGPDPEIFTKAPPMSAVGTGARVGIRRDSNWSNPEPELALVIDSSGDVVGATLANDVNLRDIEGRSALLLGTAKDNNAACSVGPFIRLLDPGFQLDEIKRLVIELEVWGGDGFVMRGESSLAEISRDLDELVGHVIGPNHQYPDGVVLLSGTMFAPTEDRGQQGQGFTHHVGDVVRIACAGLGALVNEVAYCDDIEPWVFGTRALMESLARRDLLGSSLSGSR